MLHRMSGNQDNSYANRLRFMRGKIAIQNPSAISLITPGIQNPHSAFLTLLDGRINATYKAQAPDGTSIAAPGCCVSCDTCEVIPYETASGIVLYIRNDETGEIDLTSIEENLSSLYGEAVSVNPPPSGYLYDYAFIVGYVPVCSNATYTLQAFDEDDIPINIQIQYFGPSPPSFEGGSLQDVAVFYPVDTNPNVIASVKLTVTNNCSTSTGDAYVFCFLAGTPVSMADGTTKPIETIAVGDRVLGAFGEINTITGLQNHQLGFGTISNINGEHKTTSHHPHVSPDHRALCVSPAVVTSFAYGKHYMVTGADGKKERRLLKGLSRDRVGKLEVGMELQTLTGSRTVATIERVPMPPSTPVYHLAVDGSHTYVVDGYAVYGWADETDFDYDTWTPKA